MNYIQYNIRKRFSIMPCVIQVIIFFFASLFMLIYDLLFIELETKVWINIFEQAIFMFFSGFSFLFFIALMIRMFSYEIPSYKNFMKHKIAFIIAQIIMILVCISGIIAFSLVKEISLGHGLRDSFYQKFIIATFSIMIFICFLSLYTAVILKHPSKK